MLQLGFLLLHTRGNGGGCTRLRAPPAVCATRGDRVRVVGDVLLKGKLNSRGFVGFVAHRADGLTARLGVIMRDVSRAAVYVCMYVELETTTAPGQPPTVDDSSGCV